MKFWSSSIILLICFAAVPKGSEGSTSLKISENNGTSVFVEMLRGRDGLPGRDGTPGKDGKQGPAGPRGPAGRPGSQSGGAIYTRWGKSSCPQTPGTQMLYSGLTGGTHYNVNGGAANRLCMPKDPEYSSTLRYIVGVNAPAHIYGSEYSNPIQGSWNHDAPCAVCYVSTRSTVIMIPAKASCPSTWTREYYGYLMTEAEYSDRQRSMFDCVDEDQESLPGTSRDDNGVLFHHVEANCDNLPCPPYNTHQEVNCVVCTK